MAITFDIDPVSRIEGHLKIEITVDDSGPNEGYVTDCKMESKLYRGFENILRRRDPRDAPVIVQRI